MCQADCKTARQRFSRRIFFDIAAVKCAVTASAISIWVVTLGHQSWERQRTDNPDISIFYPEFLMYQATLFRFWQRHTASQRDCTQEDRD
jgi:hypothetical protein